MSDEPEIKLNMDDLDNSESGLSQEKFADLFRYLDESVINGMLESSGLTDADLAEADLASAAPEASPEETPEAASEEEPATESEPEGSPEKPSEETSADTPEVTPEMAAFAEEGLQPEHIGHLLKVLGDDIIGDMLENAGLTHEDLDTALDDDQKGGETGSTAADVSAGTKKKRPRRPRRKGAAVRRFLFVLIFVSVIALVAALNTIYNSVTINSNDPIQYSEHSDEISADEGLLNVNNVSVTVPTDGSEEYSISYSWSEDDEKYPSVPHAITAIYSGEEENKLYSISLYRNETIQKKDIKSGKKASNWFDDWTVVNDGDILQAPLKSGEINGFYIYPKQPEDEGSASDYNDYSYYFAVKEKSGVSIYVIEGVCLDPEYDTQFRTVMDNCIHSIKVR